MKDTFKHICKRLLAGIRANPVAKQTESGKPADRIGPACAPVETDCQSGHKQEQERTASASVQSQAQPSTQMCYTRTGVPIIRPTDDLHRLFVENAQDQEGARRKASPASAESEPDKIVKSRPENRKGGQACSQIRHGIPIFKSSDDLTDFFQDGEAPDDSSGYPPVNKIDEADFGRMVDETLCDADCQEMIRAKKKGEQEGRKEPFRRRPGFRPPPREGVDLHGCTAEQGRLRAEAFIRSSRSRGLDAIRIIVGRGNHSQDGPVLPRVVEDLVIDLKKQGIVDSFNWEGSFTSRSGALLVYPDFSNI